MDAVKQRLTQFASQLQPFITQTWYILRSSRTTVVLLLVLAVVLLLGLIIPQQPSADLADTTARVIWVASLSPWIQPAGNLLFSLGISSIFQTFWFWLPVAVLLLNSLIALADYTPGSWRRLGQTTPPIEWQHPLARRVEHSVRLSNFPDNFSEILEERLRDKGLVLYESSQPEQRVTSAVQRRWAWLGVVIFYTGLIVWVGAFLLTYYSVKTDRFTLWPFQPRSVSLLQGTFELTDSEAGSNFSRVTYTASEVGQSPQTLTWRRYQPTFLNNTLILPVAVEPILTVEVRDATDTLLTLVPLQENLPPAERLSLPLSETDVPLFTIPAIDLAVQILPDAGGGDIYNVQVRSGSEAVLLENVQVEPGRVFEIDNFSAILFLKHNITVAARRDLGLPLYLVAIVLTLAGGALTLWRPPAVVWLIPEVKGMGGQLYGVMEKFGSEQKMAQFLAELLVIEDSSAKEEAN